MAKTLAPHLKRHTKILLESRGWSTAETIFCEIRAEGCQNIAVDTCHIEHRGMGGSDEKDTPENLVAGCRNCHRKLDSGQVDKELLKEKVRRIINANTCD